MYDAGLLFLAYQKDPRTAFVPIFTRLSELDAMNHRGIQLAAAYQAFSSGNGAAASTAAAVKVSESEGKIDALCPEGVGYQLLPGQAVP